MSNPEPPTLAEIEQALKQWHALEHYRGSIAILERLAACLRSGEYALVSRADRKNALEAERVGTISACATYRSDGRAYQAEARRLLQLETP